MALKGLGLKKLGYVPEVDFKLENDGAGDVIKEWLHGDAQPSDSAIATAQAAAIVDYDALAYSRTRRDAYPKIQEQLDLLYHDMTAGKLDATGEWHKAIKAVKDATAKPS